MGGLTGATPVEAFEAGAAHTAAEQLTTGRDEWPAEEPASRAGRAAAAAHRPRAAGAAVGRYVHDRRPDGQGHRSRLCVCRTADVTADNHRHLPGVDSLRCVVMTAARKVTAPARERPLALLYRRVSSRQQVELGASLDPQATVLIAECDRRGWDWRLVTERAKSVKTCTARGWTTRWPSSTAGTRTSCWPSGSTG